MQISNRRSGAKGTIDKVLIVIQVLILCIGLTFHLTQIIGNYDNSQSPLIPEEFIWDMQRVSIIHGAFYVITIIISIVLIIRYYSKAMIVTLLLLTLLFDYILARLIL